MYLQKRLVKEIPWLQAGPTWATSEQQIDLTDIGKKSSIVSNIIYPITKEIE